MSELAFQGSLLLLDVFDSHAQKYMWNQTNVDAHSPMWTELIRIESPHMTLFSSAELKQLKADKNMSNREFKEWMREQIPLLPALPPVLINFTEFHFAEESEKQSLYLKLSNGVDFLFWKDEVATMIGMGGLPYDLTNYPKPHISVANLTGNPQHSVADVDSPRVYVVWIEETFSYDGQVYATKQAAIDAYQNLKFTLGVDYRIEAKVVRQ